MQKKPIILILTSHDDTVGAADNIASAVRAVGTHNVVVISDDKYGADSAPSGKRSLVLPGKQAKSRAAKICNAVKRYRPEFVLTVTPYAYSSTVDAKKRTGFDADIFYFMPYFTVDKAYDDTGVFIVENADMKAQLVAYGVPSKHVMTMGLPFDIAKKTPLEIAAAKQELGLPRSATVFLNAGQKDGASELFSLLLDQGDVINVVVYCSDQKIVAQLRAKADLVRATNVVILQNAEQFDAYLSASDAVVTCFDRSVIYKCFKLGKPVITFGRGEQVEKELDYLVERGLILRSRDNIDVVALVYRLMQTGVAASYVTAAEKWVELCSLENVANYLASYMKV